MSRPIESLSAVTLVTADMAASVAFYGVLGFEMRYGGPDAEFTSFGAGDSFLNLQLDPDRRSAPEVWGRAIFWVDDVDAVHDRARAAGLHPQAAPQDAPWGERYFHIRDPDGHEISIARPLAVPPRRGGPAVTPEVTYDDPVAGVDWLTEVVGFDATLVVPDGDGSIVHAELDWRGAFVYVGARRDDDPWGLGPSRVCIAAETAAAVDGLHERVTAAGAEIVVALGDTPFGSHQFVARDPEGNLWVVGTYGPGSPDG